MVTLKSLYTVTPARPTPNGDVYLSECDQIKAWTHVPIIYVYKSTNPPISSSILDMKISLSQALFHFYPLAGRLHWTEGGRLELHCNAMGAHLLEAESEERVDDLGDFCPSDRLHMLVPRVDYTCPIEKLPLFLAQLTRFRCGGVSIGIAISHILADGLSTMTFMNSWATLTSGECLDLEPFHDRSLLRPREPFTPPRFDHEEFKNWPLLIGCSDNIMERKKETSVATLRVTRHQIEKLKYIANENMGRRQRPYNSFEVLTGHLWRCACLVRPSENTQKSRLRILVECRNRLNPPLPKEYFGNVAFPSSTPTCVFGDLRSLPLSYAAGKIREANEKVTDEYIMSALSFITSQQDSSGFRTSFQTKGLAVEGTFLGNPNISANSWVSLPLYGADFGWGKPVHVGPSSLVSDGKLIILPTSDRDGSFVVVICLQTAHMDAFKKSFYQNMFSKL